MFSSFNLSHNYNKKTRQKLKKFSTPGCGYRYESSSSRSGDVLAHSYKCFLSDLVRQLILIDNQNTSGNSNNLKLELPPHHLIHNPRIRLNNLHHLRRNILIDIIRHGNPMIPRGVLTS